MIHHTPKLTNFMLKITALLALLTMGLYLWSFSIFFTDTYQSENYWQLLIRYIGNLSPVFLVTFFALIAYIKRDFRWLALVILFENLAIFYQVAAAWVFRWDAEAWELIVGMIGITRWGLILFLPAAVLTFFIGCYQAYNHRLKYLNHPLRVITYLLLLSAFFSLLLLQYTTYVWSPMLYMMAKTFWQQIEIAGTGVLPIFFFSFLAIFCVYSRYYYPLVLHLIFAPHYLFYGTAATIPQIIKSLDKSNILAHSTTYLYIPFTLMFVLAIIIFVINIFSDYRAYVSRKKLSQLP